MWRWCFAKNASADTPSRYKPLFQTRLMPTLLREYDVMRDGKRFPLNVPTLDNADEPITVIVNGPGLLKK